MGRPRRLIEERRPAALIVDPLAELHDVEENDNTALRHVLAAFRGIATEYDIAVVVLHHTRKGALAAGDPDTARGASALIGGARIVLTLLPMSEDDAQALGIPKSRHARSAYVRLDDGKQNYAAIGDARWYEKIPYPLRNGEHVPALEPWMPPDMWGAPAATFNAILDEIDAGFDGRRYSVAPSAKDRAAWPVVRRHLDRTEAQAREIIKTWFKTGVLVVKEYDDPVDRKKRDGLSVNPAKRPS
jgi:hypothetical protein